MSSLQGKINSDLKEAMKLGDTFKLGVLRMLTAALHNREIEKKTKSGDSELNDEDVIGVVGREAKKRKEAADLYLKGNRMDLFQKEKSELEILNEYLPGQLTEEEIERVIDEVLKRSRASGQKDFGRVMGEAIKELKGRADGARVAEIIKDKLGSE